VTISPGRTLARHHDFSRLWFAFTASQVGIRVGAVAVSLAAVTLLNASPWQVGLLTALQSIGVLLIGLPAGVWVDRVRRMRLMRAMDLLRAAALATIPVAAATGHLRLALLFGVGLLSGLATACFDIAQLAYLPRLVGTDRVVEANARLQASQSVSAAGGPGLGGVLVGLFGATSTIVVTCLTYMVSYFGLRRIRQDEAPAASPDERHLIREIGEGLRYVFADRVLRAIALSTAGVNLFLSAVAAVQVVFLARTVGFSAPVVGLFLAVSGVGGMLAALTARRWTSALGQGRTIWLSLSVTQPFGLLLGFTHAGWRAALFPLGWCVIGYGSTLFNIVQVSYRQVRCPNRLLGRVQASSRFLAWGTVPIGSLLGGVAAEAWGTRAALLAAAAGMILSTGWLTWSPLPSMRGDLDHGEPPG
jgi:predicted MFS family arabinose efflux permease